jgi:hypothetical protein
MNGYASETGCAPSLALISHVTAAPKNALACSQLAGFWLCVLGVIPLDHDLANNDLDHDIALDHHLANVAQEHDSNLPLTAYSV